MLVLISFALVLVAAGLLVVGLLQDGSALIYASIICSIAAGVLLGVAVRSSKPKAAAAGDGAPAGDAPPAPVPTASVATQTSAPTSPEPVTAVTPAVATIEAPAAPARPPAPVPVVDETEEDVDLEAEIEEEEAADDVAAEVLEDDVLEDDDEDFFPIADYDELRVGEILPLLPQLYEDELDVVEARERETKRRKAVLARLAELREGAAAEAALEDEVEDDVEEEVTEPEEDEAVEPEADESDELVAADDEWAADDDWDGEEGGFFPIADYDDLRVNEIVPLLPQLTQDELVEVREREAEGAARSTILNDIDRRLGRETRRVRATPARTGGSNGARTTKAAGARSAAATSRASAAKAPAAKKAAAKKASASKASATKKKAPAKKAPAKRAGTTRR